MEVAGLTGQAPWLIYSSPQLTGRACSFFANAASLDGRSPKRRSVVALIPLTVHFIVSSLSNEEELMNFPLVRSNSIFMQPPQEDGPVNTLAKMYVEIDGKQFTDWTRELTYAEATK